MSIITVPPQIVKLASGINGIVAATDPPPAIIDTAEMPHLHVWSGRAQDKSGEQAQGDWTDTEIRQYRIQVAVSPAGQGMRAETESDCRTLLKAVKDFYRARPNLGGLDWVQSVRIVGDSGPIYLPEYQLSLIGFDIYLETTEYVDGDFHDYD